MGALKSGERIAPQSAWILYGENDEQCRAIASYGAGLSEVAAKLPQADLIPAWSRYANLLEGHADSILRATSPTLPPARQRFGCMIT